MTGCGWACACGHGRTAPRHRRPVALSQGEASSILVLGRQPQHPMRSFRMVGSLLMTILRLQCRGGYSRPNTTRQRVAVVSTNAAAARSPSLAMSDSPNRVRAMPAPLAVNGTTSIGGMARAITAQAMATATTPCALSQERQPGLEKTVDEPGWSLSPANGLVEFLAGDRPAHQPRRQPEVLATQQQLHRDQQDHDGHQRRDAGNIPDEGQQGDHPWNQQQRSKGAPARLLQQVSQADSLRVLGSLRLPEAVEDRKSVV